MEVTIQRDGTIVIAHIDGRVEGGTSATAFQESLQEAIEADDQGMILECSHLDYISSAGIRAIAIVLNDTKARGMTLDACQLTPPVRKVFDVIGFNQLMSIHETLEEARETTRAITP